MIGCDPERLLAPEGIEHADDAERDRLERARRDALAGADKRLRAALAAGELTIYGRKGRAPSDLADNAHEAVPATFFMRDTISLTWLPGWTIDFTASDANRRARDANAAPDYGDLCLDRGAFLAWLRGSPHAPNGSARPKRSDRAAEAAAWMRANVTAPRQRKRDDAIRDCADATGATYRTARKAWNELPEALRGTRGRPKARGK
jgi:hypothetical protein